MVATHGRHLFTPAGSPVRRFSKKETAPRRRRFLLYCYMCRECALKKITHSLQTGLCPQPSVELRSPLGCVCPSDETLSASSESKGNVYLVINSFPVCRAPLAPATSTR